MLSLEEIRKFYPKELEGFERFMLREYLQYKLLEIIFESAYAEKLCFLGGTCLRIVHGNLRFSEDLDFDNFNLSSDDFDALSIDIKTKLQYLGYEVEIKNVKRGAYHCYIRIPELLYKEGLSQFKEEKILIQLDTEPQNFNYEIDQPIINKFDVFTQINSCPLDLLLAQKFFAVLNRKRNKGRDFFDIVYLLGKGIKPNYAYLTQKIGIQSPEELKQSILEKCNKLNMKEMAVDVHPFLFNTNDDKKIKLFPKYLEQVKLG
ncbi:nucleotidyl transferase AbiEii/AbiGii toxin family protein [Aquiflexum sp.]|uniref:nucleotidyl transferase AbiEii/AbiGii toxin family protein n=1 Tax=Aquiflexum sp. TaxID=1872584 RepID=UPI0035934C7A